MGSIFQMLALRIWLVKKIPGLKWVLFRKTEKRRQDK